MTRHTVRPFEPGDFDAWYPLWLGYQAFYETDIPPEASRATWQRFHDPVEPMWGAFACDDGRPVGIVHYLRQRTCWSVGDLCYLEDLYVDAAARAHGVGRLLIEYVYAQALAFGCVQVYWLTHETNRNAMLLYDRIADRSGFVHYRKVL
ncbi:MAG: GNAT family N-acetyltransferase [Steroidobacteraceae bacterium]